MATKGGSGGGEKSVDDLTFVGIIVLGLAVGAFLVWMAARDKITMFYVYARRVQLVLVDALGALGVPGAASVHEWFQKACAASDLFSRCSRDFKTARWSEIANSSLYVNLILLVAIISAAAWMLMRVQLTHPNFRFRKKLNVKQYIREKKAIYPHLRMFDALELADYELNDARFGMSMTARQFAYRNRLIAGWIDEADGSCTPTLDRVGAEGVFRLQLGALWTGFMALTPAQTMLTAIVIPRVAATNSALNDDEFKKCIKTSEEMVRWCWELFVPKPGADLSWLTPEVDLTHPREVIAQYIDSPPVRALLQKHAYVKTVLYAMFVAARSLGVLPPTEMRWMRFFDRDCWYMVQNFGRPGVYPEGGAAHSHFLYEIKSKECLIEPQLDKAVTGLEDALLKFRYDAADRRAYELGKDFGEILPPESDKKISINDKKEKNDKKA